MVSGKKVAIFNWEWGRKSAPRDGQKIPLNLWLRKYRKFTHSNYSLSGPMYKLGAMIESMT